MAQCVCNYYFTFNLSCDEALFEIQIDIYL